MTGLSDPTLMDTLIKPRIAQCGKTPNKENPTMTDLLAAIGKARCAKHQETTPNHQSVQSRCSYTCTTELTGAPKPTNNGCAAS